MKVNKLILTMLILASTVSCSKKVESEAKSTIQSIEKEIKREEDKSSDSSSANPVGTQSSISKIDVVPDDVVPNGGSSADNDIQTDEYTDLDFSTVSTIIDIKDGIVDASDLKEKLKDSGYYNNDVKVGDGIALDVEDIDRKDKCHYKYKNYKIALGRYKGDLFVLDVIGDISVKHTDNRDRDLEKCTKYKQESKIVKFKYRNGEELIASIANLADLETGTIKKDGNIYKADYKHKLELGFPDGEEPSNIDKLGEASVVLNYDFSKNFFQSIRMQSATNPFIEMHSTDITSFSYDYLKNEKRSILNNIFKANINEIDFSNVKVGDELDSINLIMTSNNDEGILPESLVEKNEENLKILDISDFIVTSDKDINSIIKGDSVKVKWNSANATDCRLLQNDNVISKDINESNGKTINLFENTLLKLRCKSDGIKKYIEKDISIEVKTPGKIIIDINTDTAYPSKKLKDSSVTINWNAENANSCSLYRLNNNGNEVIVYENAKAEDKKRIDNLTDEINVYKVKCINSEKTNNFKEKKIIFKTFELCESRKDGWIYINNKKTFFYKQENEKNKAFEKIISSGVCNDKYSPSDLEIMFNNHQEPGNVYHSYSMRDYFYYKSNKEEEFDELRDLAVKRFIQIHKEGLIKNIISFKSYKIATHPSHNYFYTSLSIKSKSSFERNVLLLKKLNDINFFEQSRLKIYPHTVYGTKKFDLIGDAFEANMNYVKELNKESEDYIIDVLEKINKLGMFDESCNFRLNQKSIYLEGTKILNINVNEIVSSDDYISYALDKLNELKRIGVFTKNDATISMNYLENLTRLKTSSGEIYRDLNIEEFITKFKELVDNGQIVISNK